MKTSLVVIPGLLAALMLLSSLPPASAFDEMSGITMSFSPIEMNGGESTHMVVTLYNSNDRPLTVTTLTVQIYDGMMWGSMDKYSMYHINPYDAVVPANGSKQYALDGAAPNYVGTCSVVVTVGGILQGNENASIGLFTASTMINPGIPPGLMGLGIILLILPIAVVVILVIVVILLLGKKKSPSPGFQTVCPSCGMETNPGSSHCTGCGRKL